jgi:uncharacterized membrane protein YphA (DoxX/SURF4 family)
MKLFIPQNFIIHINIVIRIFLGSIFIISGLLKIFDLDNFYNIIRLFIKADNIVIIIIGFNLSFLEFILGLMLVLKIQIKYSLLCILSLLLAFIFLNIYSLFFGKTGSCGCFGNYFKRQMGIEIIIQDIVLLILCLLVYPNKLFEGIFKNRNIFNFLKKDIIS